MIGKPNKKLTTNLQVINEQKELSLKSESLASNEESPQLVVRMADQNPILKTTQQRAASFKLVNKAKVNSSPNTTRDYTTP